MQTFLYTTYYKEQSPDRRQELLNTIRLNSLNEHINSVCILSEQKNFPELDEFDIEIIHLNQRPRYQDFFNVINERTGNEDINIIANTDISFTNQLQHLKSLDMRNKCLALSRWEKSEKEKISLYNHNDSQDTWIFQGRIKKLYGDFSLGVPRCDNRLLFELQKAGYKVINPAYNIITIHHHEGDRKKYQDENLENYVDPPYAYIYPHNIFNFFRLSLFNIFRENSFSPYRYDKKKINKWIPVRIYRAVYKLLLRKNLPLIGYD